VDDGDVVSKKSLCPPPQGPTCEDDKLAWLVQARANQPQHVGVVQGGEDLDLAAEHVHMRLGPEMVALVPAIRQKPPHEKDEK
jgi:hypothetical protein